MGYICAVKDCGHSTARDKGKCRFCRFPAIVVNQGKEIRESNECQRRQWFANIYRTEFNDKKAENLEFAGVTLFVQKSCHGTK